MDKKACSNCILFKEKYKNVQVIKREKYLLAIIDRLPKNPDGSVNHEDIVFADNARRALTE